MSTVEERLAMAEARIAVLEARAAAPAPVASTGRGGVATAYDMDGEYGDPVVKKDPGRWKGDSYAGCKMSECSPEFLDVLAEQYDWMGDQDDAQGKTWTSKKPGSQPRPASTFKRKDASLARGWAARKRQNASRYGGTSAMGNSAKHTGSPEPDAFDTGASDMGASDDEIPF